jgi:tetrahydromethanopterin S-methyltransferase subunit G
MNGFGEDMARHIALVYGAFVGLALLVAMVIGVIIGAALT